MSVRQQGMSTLSSLSKNKLFDSVEDIVFFVKKLEVEDNVYLRRDKPLQSVSSYNKNSKVKKKMDGDTRWIYGDGFTIQTFGA